MQKNKDETRDLTLYVITKKYLPSIYTDNGHEKPNKGYGVDVASNDAVNMHTINDHL